MKTTTITKERAATEIARLEQQARDLRAGHAEHIAELEAQLAEARRLHKIAIAHEQTLGRSLKNVLSAITGG
jgi:hypothetical protein